MFDIGGMELVVIVLFVVIFFGPRKLPELAQSLGKGMREFKRAQREFTQHINIAFEDEQRKTSSSGQRGAPGTVSRSTWSAAREDRYPVAPMVGAAEPSLPPDNEPKPDPADQPLPPRQEPPPTDPGTEKPVGPPMPHPEGPPTLLPGDEDFPRIPPNA